MSSIENKVMNSELLRIYYGNYFPFEKIFKWLSSGHDKKYIMNREFSFTLPGEIYLRFLSFSGADLFLKRLITDVPIKIDIGAVYNGRPSLRRESFEAVERELVFDIDLTDYDDTRRCCRDKSMCALCWKFIVFAVCFLENILRNELGYNQILWVYSGRRGVHCWVSDRRARALSQSHRKAIINYIGSLKSIDKRTIKHLCRVFKGRNLISLVQETFEEVIIEDQKYLGLQAGRDSFLASFEGPEPLKQEIGKLWSTFDPTSTSSRDYWDSCLTLWNSSLINKDENGGMVSTMYKHIHPRLDSNVSIHINHLLKSPFCIHPATGKICVAFDPQHVLSFNPEEVPTCYGVCDQTSPNHVLHLEYFNASLKLLDALVVEMNADTSEEHQEKKNFLMKTLVF